MGTGGGLGKGLVSACFEFLDLDALYPERSAQRRVKAISECFVPSLDGGQQVL